MDSLAYPVLRAIESESARGDSYLWGARDCTTLIAALCRELQLPVPAYGPWRLKPERTALADALRDYTTLGNAHATGLEQTGKWARGPYLDEDDEQDIRPSDVISISGNVLAENGTEYRPKVPGAHMTGIIGPDCRLWVWSAKGLSPTVSIENIEFQTRIK